MTHTTPKLGHGAEAAIRASIDLHMRIQKKTRRDLAAHLGISPQGITRRLEGATPITINELEQMAGWLNLPLATLLGAEAEPTERSA